jgi:hypothetical protein
VVPWGAMAHSLGTTKFIDKKKTFYFLECLNHIPRFQCFQYTHRHTRTELNSTPASMCILSDKSATIPGKSPF